MAIATSIGLQRDCRKCRYETRAYHCAHYRHRSRRHRRAARRTIGSPPPAPAPIAQIETVDVLIAGSDIGLGSTVSSQDLRWQSWPAESAGSQFIRRSDNPDAINQIAGSITRQSFANGEPIREAKLIKAKGSGYMAAILPKGKRAIAIDITPDTSAAGFILPNDHVDVILARRDAKEADKAAGADPIPARSSCPTSGSWRSIRPSRTRTASAWLSARPRRSSSRRTNRNAARAKLMGVLTLSLRSIVDFDGASDDDGSNTEARQSINIVRFGVSATTSK